MFPDPISGNRFVMAKGRGRKERAIEGREGERRKGREERRVRKRGTERIAVLLAAELCDAVLCVDFYSALPGDVLSSVRNRKNASFLPFVGLRFLIYTQFSKVPPKLVSVETFHGWLHGEASTAQL